MRAPNAAEALREQFRALVAGVTDYALYMIPAVSSRQRHNGPCDTCARYAHVGRRI